MDGDLLKAFLAVAETGGFGSAARQLNRTQSAVSLQIKRLEERIGAQLFARTSRSVALTPAGTRLLPYARRILHLQQEAHSELDRDDAAVPIRFALTEEHAAAYLPRLLLALRDAYPEARVVITCGISSDLVDQFEDGKQDLVLAVRHKPTKTGRLLGLEQIIWVASEDFPSIEEPVLPLALNPDGCLFRAHALAALGRVGRAWCEPYVSQSPTGINLPVQASLAVTVKTPRSLPPGCIDVGERLGLPALGLAEIEMHASPARIGDAFRYLVGLVENTCGTSGAQVS
ncbi:MAG: LysR family transcriptional regulator [Maritimibacter sp.]|jgi:DNA-binding transcriptional LysR family regulator